MRIGVISDTHGLLRPEALTALAGVEHILHAGDVGNPAILDALRQIAPLTAIRGNIDTQGPCALLPGTDAIELAGRTLLPRALRSRPRPRRPGPLASPPSSAVTPIRRRP